MKTKIGLILTAVVATVAAVVVAIQPAQAAVGIRISNGRLVEGNGQPLVLRGINHAHTWYKSQTASFAAIKAAGANVVRVVVSGGRWQPAETTQDIANIISLCKTNRLICVLENHDTTGFNEQGGAVSLDQSVSYWISVQSALTGQENYVILNIGNEPFGNGSNPASSTWPAATSAAIQRLRSAGFQHTIMVDAPNWGQDWAFVMRDNAAQVLAADATGNTIFSVHM
jgi:mannan endo-1,4-beta-mannosidase